MKRIAIMAAMGLLLAFGADAQAQSGTSADVGAVTGNFNQAQGLGGLQQSLSGMNGAQRDAIVQSLQSVINQMQSQPTQPAAAAMPAAGYGGYGAAAAMPAGSYGAAAANYGAYAAPAYSAPVASAPVYSAPVPVAPVAPVQLPPLPPIQLPPVQLPAINIPAPAPPAPAPVPQPQSFVEYGPVFSVPQPQTVFVPVIVQQPQRRHGCRLCNR